MAVHRPLHPRFLAAAAAAALMAAACGGTSTPGQAPAIASAPASAAAASGAAKPQGWDDLVAAANKEGAVSVYASQGSTYREMDVNTFQQAFPGIKVDAIFVSSAERLSRITLERQANKYLADVWISGTSDIVVTAKEAHLVQPLKPFLTLPEVVDESAWLDNRLWWSDASEPYVALEFEGGVVPIVFVNPKLVDPKQFTSYQDLLDPKWKGKIVATDIRNPGKGADPARFMYKNPQLGPPYLTRLFSEMQIKLSDDQRQLVDWVSTGAYPVGMFLAASEVLPAIKQGLSIAGVPADQFKEGGSIGPGAGAVAIVDKAPHPNAAKLYVNWLLSKAGQSAWQRITGGNSLRIDIPKDGLDPLQVPKPGVKYTPTGTEDYGRLQTGVIKQLIDDAVKKGGQA